MSEVQGKERLAGKKSIGEILDVAIAFEKTARDFYSGLVPKVSKNLRWLVEELTEEEQRHYELFSELRNRPDIEQYLIAEVATPAADRKFSDAVLLPDLGEQPDDQEILRYALYREDAAMKQYGELADSAPAGPVRDLFRFLAKEETRHKNELEKLYYQVIHSGGV
jgi:rubrerythrin